jgi:hypothetical protein
MERFCTQTIKVPFQNRTFFSSETFVKLPRSGNAISKIRLVLDVNFVNTFEEEIIKEAELIIDGNSTEKLYGEFMHVENQLITPIEKRALLSNLLCSVSPGTVYLDLSFACVKNKLFELSDDTYLRLLFNQNGSTDELFGYLLVDYLVTESIPKEPYFQKNRKVSSLPVFSESPIRLVVDTYIPGSVYELFFTVKDTSTNEYVDALKNVRLLIGDKERFNLSGYILRYIEPLKVYGRVSQKFPVYVYSFRLEENSYGQTNLTDHQRFIFDFFDNDKSYITTIWAQSRDFFYKNMRTKSVFTSDELVLSSSVTTVSSYKTIDIDASYTFYARSAEVSYSSSVDVQNVTVESTNAPDYTITQNSITFTNIDSLDGDYYANVVFSSEGFADTTCYFRFKSPTVMNNYINDQGTGFSDVFFTGNPSTVIDGAQRFNVYSGNTLNGVSTPVNGISSVVIDQYRNFLISNSTVVTKSGGYTVSGDRYYGVPSAYFGTEIIPSTNVFYTYTNNSLVNTNTINYARIHCCYVDKNSNVYVSGTTYDSSPVVFDGSTTINKGTGIKSFYAKYTTGSKYVYSIFINESSGPTKLAVSSSGPVLMFPVTSSSTLFAMNAQYQYASPGVSVVQFDANGNRIWAYNVTASSVTLGMCRVDLFDNVYFSYTDELTNIFILNKLNKIGILNVSKYFASTSSFSMNVFFSQDTTFVSYTNVTGSSAPLTTSDFLKNVPPGLTGISAYDSNGLLIKKYSSPTLNVLDFTGTVKSLYTTPLYDATYFSDTISYPYPYGTQNLWGVFVVGGYTSSSSKSSDSNVFGYTVTTGVYGPQSSNVYPSSIVLPGVERSAALVTKVGSNGIVRWASYINNVVTRLYEQSVSITSSGNVYASGTFGKYRSNIYNSDGTKFDGYLPQLGDQGVYLVKYNTDGFAYWQTYIDGMGTDEYNYSITRKFSNTYITGSSIQYGGTTVKAYNAKTTGDRLPTESGRSTTNKMFVVKYDTSGQAQWMASVNGGAANYAPAPGDICTDSNENVICTINFYQNYITGRFVQSDATTFSPILKSGSVIKMNKDGMAILGFYIENCAVIRGVCTSPVDDSIFVCGRMPNGGIPLNFYQWNSGTSSIVNSGQSLNPARSSSWQGFIAKYSSAGVYQWSGYVVHLNQGVGQSFGYAVGCDSYGNVYLTGDYENSIFESVVYGSDGIGFPRVLPGKGFGAGFGDNYVGGYLTKFNSSGICQWVVRIDSGGSIYPYINLSVDLSDNTVNVTGQYYGRNVKFYDSNGGEHDSFQPESPSQLVAYCVKYDSDGFLKVGNSY